MEYHSTTALQKISNTGMISDIAINSGISIEIVMEMLRIVKKVLVMYVNPGKVGQMFLSYIGKEDHKVACP